MPVAVVPGQGQGSLRNTGPAKRHLARRRYTVINVAESPRGPWQVDDDVLLWIDPGGGIALKAVTSEGDPVELSATQARTLVAALFEAVAVDESD